jgi:hypothetical protein
MRKYIFYLFIIFLIIAPKSYANDFEIEEIAPIFNDSTPGFGEFKIKVEIKNNTNKEQKLYVSCIYAGLTKSGVYFKNQPQIMKQYKVVKISAMSNSTVLFEKGFRSYHPETTGEIIVSIVGSGVVRSLPLKTSFHPNSND